MSNNPFENDSEHVTEISFLNNNTNNNSNKQQKVIPPWLQEANKNNNIDAEYGESGNRVEATSTEINPNIPRLILYTRISNLILSVCMILTSLLALLTTQSMTTGVLSCYVVVFACLLCCFETHLKQISKLIAMNFGFMYSAKSRSAFMMFIGTIMFSFSLFGKLIGAAMLLNACFNIFIIFRYPEFEDAQRDHATAEIKEFLASNPAFSQQAMNTGIDIFKSNPGLAAQGLQLFFASNGGGVDGDRTATATPSVPSRASSFTG